MTSELTYYRSMLLFLSVIWLVTLSWFSLYLKINFSLPAVGFWFGALLLTLALSYAPNIFHAKPLNQPKLNLLWLLLMIWVTTINTGLLYETGGTINPMMGLLLLPLALGMLILTPSFFMVLAVIVALFYLLLSNYYVPIMSMKVQSLQAFFAWYLHGSVMLFMVLVLFLALFILPLKHKLEKQRMMLERQHQQALQNEYLMSIASMALTSVHQLSTPLNTMALINDLLKNEVRTDEGKGFLQTTSEQLEVCSNALQRLRNRADASQQQEADWVGLDVLVADLKQEFALIQQQSSLQVITDGVNPTSDRRMFITPSFKIALLNLLDNAARYSPDFVEITFIRADKALVIQIKDHGGGLNKKALEALGQKLTEEHHGMGMGVFLTRMIIERFQGQLVFRNHQQEDHKGLIAEISLPDSIMENSHQVRGKKDVG